jgi:hypothetical protein
LLDGVTASVNLSTERAWVSAPPHLSPRDLAEAVAAASYTAEAAFGFLNPWSPRPP